MGDIVVVGAGLTGLTVAHELAARGYRVAVVERAGAVGGLARTFRYAEGAFDVGPHRFHTDDAAVEAFRPPGDDPISSSLRSAAGSVASR